jgi:rubredoxin
VLARGQEDLRASIAEVTLAVVSKTAPRGGYLDASWRCQRCPTVLGVYNEESGEIRIRYKELYVSVSGLIVGGYLDVICRNCGWKNRAEGDGRLGGKPVSPLDDAPPG